MRSKISRWKLKGPKRWWIIGSFLCSEIPGAPLITTTGFLQLL
jgi:hypothetical protein